MMPINRLSDFLLVLIITLLVGAGIAFNFQGIASYVTTDNVLQLLKVISSIALYFAIAIVGSFIIIFIESKFKH